MIGFLNKKLIGRFICPVVRGQLDPVFSFKDVQKREQEHVHTGMQFQWAMYNITYSIVMRTIIRHTIHVHVGALGNYTKNNNITKLLTEL